MTRAWIAAVSVAALVLIAPATALAHGDDRVGAHAQNRSKACKALRAQMGADLFRQMYGTSRTKRNAHGKCVSKHRRLIRRAVVRAANECRAERAATQLRHDDGERGDDRRAAKRAERRAFRQCVRQKVRAQLAELRAAFRAAAQSCLAERQLDPAAFRQKYGWGKKHRRAFFRCVVATVRANRASA